MRDLTTTQKVLLAVLASLGLFGTSVTYAVADDGYIFEAFCSMLAVLAAAVQGYVILTSGTEKKTSRQKWPPES